MHLTRHESCGNWLEQSRHLDPPPNLGPRAEPPPNRSLAAALAPARRPRALRQPRAPRQRRPRALRLRRLRAP